MPTSIAAERINSEDAVRVEVRFKNARLYDAISESVVPLHSEPRLNALIKAGPVSAFCKIYGLKNGEQQRIYRLLSLQIGPMARSPRGGWQVRPLCEKLAALLCRDVWWLFPLDLYSVKWPRLAVNAPAERLVPLTARSARGLITQPDQEASIQSKEIQRVIGSALEKLTPRESKVLTMRYGLSDTQEHTLEDIGKALNVGPQRVYQIHAKAIRKLRHPLRGLYALRPAVTEHDQEEVERPREYVKREVKSRSREVVSSDIASAYQARRHMASMPRSDGRLSWFCHMRVERHELNRVDDFIALPPDAVDPRVERYLVPTTSSDGYGRITVIVEGTAIRGSAKD